MPYIVKEDSIPRTNHPDFHPSALHYSLFVTFAVGLDHLLAQHIAHLFIRDPVLLYAEKVEQDLEKDMDHFEVIQCYGEEFEIVSLKLQP